MTTTAISVDCANGAHHLCRPDRDRCDDACHRSNQTHLETTNGEDPRCEREPSQLRAG